MLIKLLFQKFIVYIMNNLCAKFGCHISSNSKDKQGGRNPPPQALSVSNHPGQIGLRIFQMYFHRRRNGARGGGFFHSKGTWGCAAREGILFRTSSLAKGVLFGNFSRVRSRQGYAFWEFWSKRCQNSVIFVKKPNFLNILV